MKESQSIFKKEKVLILNVKTNKFIDLLNKDAINT